MAAPVTEELVLTRFDVSEVRMTEVDAAIAFSGGPGEGRSGWSLHHNLSVLARFEGKIIGAALFFDGNVGRPILDVCVGRGKGGQESEDQVELLRRLAGVLVDKALLKLNSDGRSRFSVRVGGRTDPGRFWSDASWISRQTESPEPTLDDSQTQAPKATSTPPADDTPPVDEEQESSTDIDEYTEQAVQDDPALADQSV
ncbi:MAG: hypothetical protein RIG82_06695 [Phycisphaeraceae bacterium]